MMQKNIWAKIIDIIFHPLLIPSYFTALMLWFGNNNLALSLIRPSLRPYIFLFVAITSVIIPTLCFWLLKITKIYVEKETNKKTWTALSCLLMAVIFFAISRSMVSLNISGLLLRFFLWNFFFATFCGLVSFRYTLNFHAIATGELLGLYILMLYSGIASSQYILFAIIIMFGLSGMSQLALKKTSPLSFVLETVIGVLFTGVIWYY